jgi:hypothetical protein
VQRRVSDTVARVHAGRGWCVRPIEPGREVVLGFDMHLFVERRDEAGRWQKVGNVFTRTREEPVSWAESDDRQEGYLAWREVIEVGRDQPWTERNYELFTILGLPLRPHVAPIAPLRGLPADVSEEVRERLDDSDDFFVGHSWLTLAELQGYEGSARYPARFVRETLPQLRRLGPPDDVRVVFAFDH